MMINIQQSAISSFHVVHLIQSYYPIVGGAERQLGALIPLLKERQVKVSVITRRHPGLTHFEVVEGVPVHRLPVPGPKPLASLAFTGAALALLKRLRPQVIHAHDLLSPTTTAMFAKRFYGTPIVVKVLRGGHLGDLERLKTKPNAEWRIAWMRQTIDYFIAISREIDADLDSIGVPSERRVFIPNGVDLVRFTPLSETEKIATRASLGLPDGLVTISSGRLVPEKRVDHLLSVWNTVRGAHPNAWLYVLGSGEEETRLRKIAGAGVCFLGTVEDVLPYLQSADLFVLPSTTEGLSNALLEAMACGLPIIATSVGGTMDVIEHGVNGWLYPSADISALRDALLSLLGNPALRKTLGTAARQRVMGDYSLISVAERLRDLYASMLPNATSLPNASLAKGESL
jgi:glycosyltransferase involved in cell wall biosynthesis